MALDNKIKEQLNQYMTKLVNPVEVVANLDDGPSSVSMRELLLELEGI